MTSIVEYSEAKAMLSSVMYGDGKAMRCLAAALHRPVLHGNGTAPQSFVWHGNGNAAWSLARAKLR